jgi:hypothetical protein
VSTGSWTANSNVAWTELYPLAGSRQGTIDLIVYPNFGSAARTAALRIGGRDITVTQSGSALPEASRFVQLVYFGFFGRMPSPQELQFQLDNALAKGIPRAIFADNFFHTPEFNGAGRFIAGLYVGQLARDAEYGGWLFQRTKLYAREVTQAELVSNFLNSAEYKAKFESTIEGRSDDAFIARLYKNVLLRDASAEEVSFQKLALQNGSISRVELAGAFLRSREFELGTGPRLTAFLLYAALLQRDASPGERDFQAKRIEGGKPVAELIGEFLTSQEFAGLLR